MKYNFGIKSGVFSMRNFRTALFTLLVIFLLSMISGCGKPEKIRIALSKGAGSEHYEQYEKWLKSFDERIECVNLYTMDPEDAAEELETCLGIVLTGGPDVHPIYYNRLADTARCEIDPLRDSIEFAVIEKALELKLPMLAVCRGEQILNVYLGGSLIVDIPDDFPSEIHHRCEDKDTCLHLVDVVKGTQFAAITGVSGGKTNSNHHQAVDRLSDSLVVAAYTKDGLIEAYEWKNPAGKPFMMAVQWHPERMQQDNPLSGNIAREFLKKVMLFKQELANK